MESIQTTPPNCRILNNPPALHSLKRQQLVQLCKRNGIKASGKNVELIGRLRAHASDMSDGCMSPGDEDKENEIVPLSRPSETWSVINEDSREIKTVRMDIQEEVEQETSTQSTLRGLNGSSFNEYHSCSMNSKKDSTLTSPFKAIANSLKRVGNKMSTAPAQVPTSIDDPATHNEISGLTTPITTRPSPLPSPATGNESDAHDASIRHLGQSTIRLVSVNNQVPSPPALRPFTPTFDACYSPESQAKSLQQSTALDGPLPPGAFPAAAESSVEPISRIAATSPPPFVFGSPAHQTTNTQFHSAAASVLAEMNARLGLVGTSNEVKMDILEKKNVQPSTLTSLFSQMDKPRTDVTLKFDKAHEQRFQQMEGIGDWYARRYGKGLAEGTFAGREDVPNKKRKSHVLGGQSRKIIRPSITHSRRSPRSQAPRVVSQIVDEQCEERQAKRQKISFVDSPAVVEGRDPSELETKSNGMERVESQQTQEERERERIAVKKRLEVSRARRRSSMGRVSVGANKPALFPNKPKKGKFGFLSSAKNLVKNVWNRGIGASQKQEVRPKSNVPAPPRTSGTQKKEVPGANSNSKAGTAVKQTASAAPSKSNGSLPTNKPSVRISTTATNGTTQSRTSAVTSTSVTGSHRGPIPSFSRIDNFGRTSSLVRKGSSTGTSNTRQNSTANSIGLGFKDARNISAGNARTSEVSSVPSAAPKRTSTLLAPTASSLAKMQHIVKPPSLSTKVIPTTALLTKATTDSAPTAGRLPVFAATSPRQIDDKICKPKEEIWGTILASGPPSFIPSPKSTAMQDSQAKPRPLPGRRPRISRSRVIARVGAQRMASQPKDMTPINGRRSLNAAKTRGSLGVRASGIGNKTYTRESLTSHRKRLRQSEIMRRRSKMSSIGGNLGEEAQIAVEGEALPDEMDED